MGLDLAELIMEIEDIFGIDFPEKVDRPVATVGELAAAVERFIPADARRRCYSGFSFHRLRDAIADLLDISPRALRPSSPLADLVAPENLSAFYRRLIERLGPLAAALPREAVHADRAPPADSSAERLRRAVPLPDGLAVARPEIIVHPPTLRDAAWRAVFWPALAAGVVAAVALATGHHRDLFVPLLAGGVLGILLWATDLATLTRRRLRPFVVVAAEPNLPNILARDPRGLARSGRTLGELARLLAHGLSYRTVGARPHPSETADIVKRIVAERVEKNPADIRDDHRLIEDLGLG